MSTSKKVSKKELQIYDKKVKDLLDFWLDYINKHDVSGVERLSSGPRMCQHKAKYMTIRGYRARIDVNIYDLIYHLNRLGIRTRTCCGASCSGRCNHCHKGKLVRKEKIWNPKTKIEEKWDLYSKPKQCQQSAYIDFVSRDDAVKFANIVYSESDPAEIRTAMQGFGHKNSWKWCVELDDYNDGTYETRSGKVLGKKFGPPKMDFSYLVIIPHAHLDLITKRVSRL